MKKIVLSIVIPMYNESKRAPSFLDKLVAYNNKKWQFIFVDDGSSDNTTETIKSYNFFNKKIISYKKNRGKGFAVKKGIEQAEGDFIIFIDADGSINPKYIPIMLNYLKKYDIVIGTRMSKYSLVKRPLFRELIAKVFNAYVNFLFRININDSLCGFKGFKSSVAKPLFSNLISDRWIFDVELLCKIKKYNHSLYEMPIEWYYREGSKMRIFDPIKIAFQLLKLKTRI